MQKKKKIRYTEFLSGVAAAPPFVQYHCGVLDECVTALLILQRRGGVSLSVDRLCWIIEQALKDLFAHFLIVISPGLEALNAKPLALGFTAF